jgi:hypothetical protein
MVNRIWKHHFGRGIVATPGNFGTAGARPTHPELLDWLAVEFMDTGWSIKHLHRLLLSSRTYRQSSRVSPQAMRLDPQSKLLSRMPLRRMEAEVLRDSLLFVSGQLDGSQFGAPDAVDESANGLVLSESQQGAWRRSIYVLQRRTKMPTILDSFDYPQMGPNCLDRDESIVAPQALHLLNNQMVYTLAQHFAERIRREVGDNPRTQVSRIHTIIASRTPTTDEAQLAIDAMQQLTRRWSAQIGTKDAAARALVNYCHAALNSAAFLYVD